MQEQIKQQREHQPPAIVVEALAAVAKTLRAEMRKLEASIAAQKSRRTRRSRVAPSSSTACRGSAIKPSPG